MRNDRRGTQLGNPHTLSGRALEIKTGLRHSGKAALLPTGRVGKKGSPRHCRRHTVKLFVNIILGKGYLLLLVDQFH